MTEYMFKWITQWQREVFPQATAESAAQHLKAEVNELVHDLVWSKPDEQTKSEYADCFLLLFGSAALYGLSYEDICVEIETKMEINKQRKWGKANSKGYVEHIKLKQGDIVFLKEDFKKERYAVKEYTGEISRGPNRQLNPSPVISVIDAKGKLWQFREDSLYLLSNEQEDKRSVATKLPNGM